MLIVGFVVYSGVEGLLQADSLDERIMETRAEIEQLRSDTEQLAALVAWLDSDAYVERIAREDLGMVRPGEEAFAVHAPRRGDLEINRTSWWANLLPRRTADARPRVAASRERRDPAHRSPDSRHRSPALSRALVESAGTGFGRPLIAAVSGGADSSAMLLLLADTQSRHGWRIHAAHVDHGIQSEDARQEFRKAAADVAAIAGASLDAVQADAVSEADASSDGLEAAARRVRYDALTQLALKRGATVVAVAHTQHDQSETVLMHILRGSGLDGLSGMPAMRALNDEVRLVRPLLNVTRDETESVCRAYGWDPVHDPSNDRLEHTRNRVRHSLLPLMREINPNVSERHGRTSPSGWSGSKAA